MSSSGNDDMVLWTIEELREQVDAHKREDKKRQAANRSRLEEWDAIIAQMPEPRAREKQGQDQEGEEEEEVEGQETTLSSRRLSLRSSSKPDRGKDPAISSTTAQSTSTNIPPTNVPPANAPPIPSTSSTIQAPSQELLNERTNAKGLDVYVWSEEEESWVSVANLSPEAEICLLKANTHATSDGHGKRYGKMTSSNNHEVCIYCFSVTKKTTVCEFSGGKWRSCKPCANGNRPCGKVVSHEGKDVVGFLPLPEDKREGHGWADLEYWCTKK